MRAYYNEFDQKAVAWLRQLIKNGDITQGEVDERSIEEVKPADLIGFDRVHFFAGIGTWDYCLNQSGWGNKPVWTASLPCQPFSAAGKGLGKSDERHLLPHFLELVRQCKPDAIFGEQVERAINFGWLDDLQANMEAEGYAIGHCVLGAHSIGAAHIRQRLYWVADSASAGGCWRESLGGRRYSEPRGSSEDCGLGIANGSRSQQGIEAAEATRYWCSYESAGGANRMADTKIASRERPEPRSDWKSYGGELDWLYCRDNKYRPVKSGIKPLVDGVAEKLVRGSDTGEPINTNATQEARVMRLKGYGNAIQAQTAMAFINAYMSL